MRGDLILLHDIITTPGHKSASVEAYCSVHNTNTRPNWTTYLASQHSQFVTECVHKRSKEHSCRQAHPHTVPSTSSHLRLNGELSRIPVCFRISVATSPTEREGLSENRHSFLCVYRVLGERWEEILLVKVQVAVMSKRWTRDATKDLVCRSH